MITSTEIKGIFRSPWFRLGAIPLAALLLFPLTEKNQLDPALRHPGREDATWRSLNNYNLIFLESWRVKGLSTNYFALDIPIDETDIRFSKPYSSYPPSYLLPAYLWEKAGSFSTDSASTIRRLAALASAGHFLLSCLAGWTVLALSSHLVPAFAAVFAALFLPPLLAFQHNVWWPDMTGLIAAAFVLLLHIVNRKFPPQPGRRLPDLLFSVSIAMGAMIDWFTVVLAVPLFFVSSPRRRWGIAAGVAIALALFLSQQFLLNALHIVAYKIRIRTGIQPQDFSFLWHLSAWLETVKRLLGWGGILLPLLAIPLACLKKESRSRLALLTPYFCAVLLHWIALNQHYPGHHYNSIRWAYGIALLPALFPKTLGYLASFAVVGWTIFTYPLFQSSLEGSATDLSAEHVAACRLVERHHSPEHFFVSQEFSYSHELMGYLWYFPLCKSVVINAEKNDDIVLAMQKRFIRSGFTVKKIERVYFLSRQPNPPDWGLPARKIDSELPWHLFEITPQ